MKISTILDHIDSGHMALPEFQRGYVWNRDQVRGLFDSLYRRHPVGGLLVWATEAKTAAHRGDGAVAAGIVKLLLDGQQRMTSLYGVVRGRSPKFFDGNAQAFTGLRFHLDTQTFAFYQPVKMAEDPLWIDVTELMTRGNVGLGMLMTQFSTQPDLAPKIGDYVTRLGHLLGILEIDLHIEEVTGADKSLDVVVDIFNRVNSGGTKLSKGDLALARICAHWPDGRDAMKSELRRWEQDGYLFNLDWLLRSMNTVLTGEAKFQHLHEKGAAEVQDALKRATRHIDTSLNLIAGRLGLDHDLLEQLRLWQGGLHAEPGHFTGWSLGARFYPVLYLMTRMGEARDWGTGLPLKAHLLGKMSRLEVHHIFPKAQLYKRDYRKPEVNALANFCFLTKDTNLDISATLPEQYFPQVEEKHPGALASQWIPQDPDLWRIDRFLDFLEARKVLLADELNRRMADLLHGDDRWLKGPAAPRPETETVIVGGIASAEEEAELEALNDWVADKGLPRGTLAFDLADPDTGEQKAVLDLAWPSGLQEERSQPVAVLLNEEVPTISMASQAGFRCFTDLAGFRDYIATVILAESADV